MRRPGCRLTRRPALVPLGLLLAWLPWASPARAEMGLVFREMFATTGQLDEANPGANFTKVTGRFLQRPGGPRMDGMPAASADLRNIVPTPYGIVDLPTDDEPRLFLCGWYHFKSLQVHGATLLAITDPYENPGPAIFVEDSTLKTGVEYWPLPRTPLPESVVNRWVFLGLAVVRTGDRQGSLRFYYKFPGQPLRQWASHDDVSIGLPILGGFQAGLRTSGSSVRCRLGAVAGYRFENNDFSDVVYPPDLIDPESGLTWYCNPATGNDANDGTAPDRAWATVSKINEESEFTGMLPSNRWETGDTLIIDTSAAPLDTRGEVLRIQTEGLNVRAAPGAEWIRVKSYRTLPGGVWAPAGIPNVYATTDAEEHVVAWEDDKFLHHPTGADLAAVSSFLSATPGSFWTDGAKLYLHPFGSTDPRTDGKRYERSYHYGYESAVMLLAPNLHVRDLHVGKTCLAHSLDNDPIGAYGLGTGGRLGNARIAHCFFYYGSKHNFGLTSGDSGDDVLVEDVRCEQGSPYGGPGAQTLFVSFNQHPLDLNITHRFHRCRSVMNAGLIGSSAGTYSGLYPVYYVHNIGLPGEPDQFALIEFVDCDFGPGAVLGGGIKNARFESSAAGSVGFNGDLVIERSRLRGPLWCLEGKSVVARHSVFERSGSLPASPVAGALDIQGCSFDGTGITGISAQEAAFFTRSGPLTFVFRNNAVRLPDAARNFGFFSSFRDTDQVAMSHNAYQLGENRLMSYFSEGGQAGHRTFEEWQALGNDLESFLATDLVLTDGPPRLGSPLLDAGVDLAPAGDFTGRPLLRRNDIGAFEGPPTRFDEWQHAHFTGEELLQPERSGPEGSLFGDGVSNLMKYALGLSAREPAGAGIFHFKKLGAGGAALDFPRSLIPVDLDWMLERSTDLEVWDEVADPAIQTLSSDETTESIRVVLPPEDGTRFFRMKVRSR